MTTNRHLACAGVAVAGLAAGLMSATLIGSAPPASAGCQPYGFDQLCDGPIQPDGTWQRCNAKPPNVWTGAVESTCFTLGDDHPLPPFDPPGHIDP